MSLLSGINDFFGLDIGTSGLRVVQLKRTGKQWSLHRYGQMAIDIKTAQSDAPEDQRKLVDGILKLVAETGITSKNVAVGIPSSRSFATVADLPKLEEKELTKSIEYQAENFIPQSLNEVKLDWKILGDSPKGHDMVEVIFGTVPNEFAETRMNAIEAAGFNVIALEPDGLALARALIAPGTNTAQMILDIGSHATDLIVTMNGTPRLIRSIPTGGVSFVKSAKQSLSIDETQARQFVYKFGLGENKLEGQVFKALKGPVDTIVGEVEKSVKFFRNRYNLDLEKIIVTGGASTLPEFPLYLANHAGKQVEIGNSWTNVAYPQGRYNELISISSNFGTAVGLAMREA